VARRTGSREDIYNTIARGRAGICPPWIRELDPVTTRALAVLNYTASHRAAPKAAAEGSPAVGTEAISSLRYSSESLPAARTSSLMKLSR
jgi:hypothetical protein